MSIDEKRAITRADLHLVGRQHPVSEDSTPLVLH